MMAASVNCSLHVKEVYDAAEKSGVEGLAGKTQQSERRTMKEDEKKGKGGGNDFSTA